MECKQCPVSHWFRYASAALTKIASHGGDDPIYNTKIFVRLLAWCLKYLEAAASFRWYFFITEAETTQYHSKYCPRDYWARSRLSHRPSCQDIVSQLEALARESSRSGKRSTKSLDRNLQKASSYVIGRKTTKDILTAIIALNLGSCWWVECSEGMVWPAFLVLPSMVQTLSWTSKPI